jgi:hypothetical protein
MVFGKKDEFAIECIVKNIKEQDSFWRDIYLDRK